jgi:predicted homoserine dehydrogenase-like protein
MCHGKLAQMGVYLPKMGFNMNPGVFVIVQKEDETVCVTRVLDMTTPEAAIVNWFPRLSTLDFD